MNNTKRMSLIPKGFHESIFKTFLNDNLHEQTMHKILQLEFNKSYDELLIDELKKPSTKDNDNELVQLFKRCSQYSGVYPQTKRSIELTIYLLQHLKPFYRFIKFNKIDLIQLRKIALNLKYQFYPKHSYIFSYREYSKKFYGIIKGTVTMKKKTLVHYPLNDHVTIEAQKRHDSISEYNFISSYGSSLSSEDSEPKTENKNKPIPAPNELRSQFEIELCRFTSGMCFGEWNLINNTIHSESAYCVEDTHVFYLTKEHFDAILSNPISQAVKESKKFVHDCIPLLTQEDLNQLKPEYYDKGAVIYTQFTKAKEFFVVYQGECALKYDPKATNIEEIHEKKNTMKIITLVDKGGIAGLESQNPNSNYNQNLIVSQDYTIIYRLNTREVEKRSNIKAYLRKLQKDKMKLMPSRNIFLYKRLICSTTSNKEIIKKNESNSDISTEAISKIKKIMIDHHKIRDANRLKTNAININYSHIKAFSSEKKSKRNKSRPTNNLSSTYLVFNNNNQGSNKNMLPVQLPIHPNSVSNVNIHAVKIKAIDHNHNNKGIVSITANPDIQNPIRQISKRNIKHIMYNSGRYNLPLFHTHIDNISQ